VFYKATIFTLHLKLDHINHMNQAITKCSKSKDTQETTNTSINYCEKMRKEFFLNVLEVESFLHPTEWTYLY